MENELENNNMNSDTDSYRPEDISSPYIARPNPNNTPLPRPVRTPANGFAKGAMIVGIIGLVSVFTFTVYPAMVLGSISIILAILSKGRDKKMHENARTGIVTGIVALCLNLCLIAGSCYVVFTIPEYREQFNEMYESMYGESFDDTLKSIQNGTYENDLY